MNSELYYEDVEIGDDISPMERVVDRDRVVRFLRIRSDVSDPKRFTDDAYARKIGLPGAIVPGGINIAMVSQLLTGWSSTVTLKKLDVVLRQVVPQNRPLQIKGIVTDKNVVGGEPQIACDVFMENEEGALLVSGQATVVLPMRAV